MTLSHTKEKKRVYAIKYEGWELLSRIKRTRKYGTCVTGLILFKSVKK
jgi:hypothetical protein